VSEARKAQDVLLELKSQVKLACSGQKTKIATQQTATGVKCSYTEEFIQRILAEHKSLLAAGKSEEEAEDALMEWVQEREEDIYNPLLRMAGKQRRKEQRVARLT
jgi:hypothetical protein